MSDEEKRCMFCEQIEDYILGFGKFLKIVHPHKSDRWGYAHPVCILEAAYTHYKLKKVREGLIDWLGIR